MRTPDPRRVPADYGFKIVEDFIESAAQIGDPMVSVESACCATDNHGVRKDALKMGERGEDLVSYAFFIG